MERICCEVFVMVFYFRQQYDHRTRLYHDQKVVRIDPMWMKIYGVEFSPYHFIRASTNIYIIHALPMDTHPHNQIHTHTHTEYSNARGRNIRK